MDVFYTQKSAKQLKIFSHSIQKRIVEKMRFYASQMILWNSLNIYLIVAKAYFVFA